MNEGALHGLPGGWVWTRLGDITEIITGNTPSKKDLLNYGDFIPFVKPPELKDCTISEASDNLSENGAKFARILPQDSVLVSCIGNLGKIGINKIPVAFNQQINSVIFPKDEIIPKYGFYYFQTLEIKIWLKGISSATTIPIVNKSKFKTTPFYFPPLPEQRAIVSKIEQLFSDLDNGIDNFKKAQEQLKRYRQSVLKAACEGKLVPTEAELARAEGRGYEPADVLLARILEERREKWNGKGKYKEPASPDTSGLSELPEGWVWVTVEQLNPPTRTCAYGVLQPGSDVKSGIPLVRVGDIKDGQINENKMKKISPQIAEKYSRTKLEGGEILITLVGAIGRTAVVPKSLSGANTARAVGVIPLNKHVSPFWINTWFQQAEKIAEMTSKSHEVARKTLNLEDVRTTLIGLPPLAEQYRIVAEVETLLSICDKMEETITESLQKAESLRQGILKKAFEGKLLNEKELEEARNAPEWEPAEKLLERIKAQKNN